jgi:hypothetical protein
MTTLAQAWNDNEFALTDNGMQTNLSSLDTNVDLFFLAGASRGKDIRPTFISALSEDEDVAIRTMLWMRDVRGGAGERAQFRNLLSYLATRSYSNHIVTKVMPLIPEVGRWDDLLVFENTPYWPAAVELIHQALFDGMRAKNTLTMLDQMSEEEAQALLDAYNGQSANASS